MSPLSTRILHFQRMRANAKAQAHPTISDGWENLYHREPQLGCCAGICVYIRHQNEPPVTSRHVTSTKGKYSTPQVWEAECTKMTSTLSCALKNQPEEDKGTIMEKSVAVEAARDAHHHTRTGG